MMRTPFGPVHLPPEYRMLWVEGEFRLSDAGGNLLFVLPARPGALADLEKYSWQQSRRLLEALAEEGPQAAPEMTLAARVGRTVRSLPRPRPHEAALAFAGGVA